MFKLAREVAIRRIYKDLFADKILEGKQHLHPRDWHAIDNYAREILFEDYRPKDDDD